MTSCIREQKKQKGKCEIFRQAAQQEAVENNRCKKKKKRKDDGEKSHERLLTQEAEA